MQVQGTHSVLEAQINILTDYLNNLTDEYNQYRQTTENKIRSDEQQYIRDKSERMKMENDITILTNNLKREEAQRKEYRLVLLREEQFEAANKKRLEELIEIEKELIRKKEEEIRGLKESIVCFNYL